MSKRTRHPAGLSHMGPTYKPIWPP